VEGNILGTDTLTGSFTLTNGITSQTFVMGGVGGPSTTGSTTDVGGTTIGALLAAINSTTIAGPDLGIVATQNLTGNGGLWLQSTTTNTTISMSPSTLVDSYSEAPTPFAGVPPSGGTESFNEILPASGSVNTGDVLTGSVKLTNGPTQHTFVMGAGPAVAGPAGVLTGNSVQVNGNTLADLAAAISWDAPMDLTAQADTTGLSMTTTVNDGDPINVSANSLVDTTQGTFSTMTLGTAGNQFASESDIVSGALDFSVGGAAKTVPLSPGETVAEMINQINNPTGLSNPNYPDGVTATWVPSTNGFGSVVLTANLAGTSGQISAATSTVTDTTTTANLSYTDEQGGLRFNQRADDYPWRPGDLRYQHARVKRSGDGELRGRRRPGVEYHRSVEPGRCGDRIERAQRGYRRCSGTGWLHRRTDQHAQLGQPGDEYAAG